jgi:hypothetical protein
MGHIVIFILAVPPGVEPGLQGSKPCVLPLHHGTKMRGNIGKYYNFPLATSNYYYNIKGVTQQVYKNIAQCKNDITTTCYVVSCILLYI